MADPSAASGRVLQVNTSAGGVPKRPVMDAWIGRLGLDGDGHHDLTEHGGPHRAVSILGIEAIRRIAAEGHPIGPGTAGENLTVAGFDVSALPVGTRLAVGDQVLLELSGPATPCQTIRDSFRDGRIARLSIEIHPHDSRMYARVLREGLVQPGDPIAVLPPDADSGADRHTLHQRLERARRAASVALWEDAGRAGIDVHLLDDGELAAAAAPGLPGPAFNSAFGLSTLPHLRDRLESHFRRHGTIGWLWSDEASALPGEIEADLLVAAPTSILGAASGDPLLVRQVAADQADTWVEVLIAATPIASGQAAAWRALAPGLAGRAHCALFLAELDGRPAGAAALYVKGDVGLLWLAAVLPEARGRGLHRSLVAARAAHASAAEDVRLIHATAVPGGPSARNLAALGFESVGRWYARPYRPLP